MRHSTDSNPDIDPSSGRNPIALFWEKWRRAVISAFIIFNIVAIGCGSYKPIAEQNAVGRFFLPYLVWTRLLQTWKLFVPTPKQVSVKYHADILFRDGSHQTWQRPYPPNWDFFERHLSYQFQKWDLATDALEQPGISTLLWTDLAGYLGRLYANPINPPEKIEFFRTQALVPPPLETGYAWPDPSQFQWKDHLLHTYYFRERRLQ